jgi:hypothetical protein
MVVRMSSEIRIGKLIFRNLVHSVEIDTSFKCLTQTATIRLPRMPKLIDPSQSEYNIQTGDPVVIKLGYDDRLTEEYTGYVSEVSPKTPLEIKCEDEMYNLKRTTVTKGWPSVTLKEVLTWLVADAVIVQCPDVVLTPFRFSYISKAKVLQKLKEEYNLTIYFRGKKLFCGFAYTEGNLGKVTYHFQSNVPKEEIDKNLIFRRKEDVKLFVKAISILRNNKRIETEVGDKDGDQTTLTFNNIQTKEELRKQATELINKLKFDGYQGSIVCLGRPYATHGMIAVFKDDRYPEREGEYFIDQIKVKYDSSGFRREIFPGRKASAPIIQ